MNKTISSFLKDDVISHSAIVFLGNGLAGVFTVFYHVMAVRILSAENYGTFNTLISFVMSMTIAVSPLRLAMSRYFSEYIAKQDFNTLYFSYTKLIKSLAVTAFIVFLLIFSVSDFFAEFIKTKIIYVVICGVIIALSLVSLLFLSLMQSLQRFKAHSFIWISASFGKLMLGSFLMYFGWEVLGGLIGYLCGLVIIILIGYSCVSDSFRKRIISGDRKYSYKLSLVPIYKYFFPAFGALFAFGLLTSVDVILVKHFFSSIEAGYYSIAQVIGKITLFALSALGVVIFPKCTDAFINNKSSLKILYKALLLGGICCFFIVTLSFLFPDMILKTFTGKVNAISCSLVGLCALAMSFYALLWIIINYLLAIHNVKFIFPLLGLAIGEVVFIYSYHPSLLTVLYTLLFFSIVSFLISVFFVRPRSFKIQ